MDEILNLIESVSVGCHSYSFIKILFYIMNLFGKRLKIFKIDRIIKMIGMTRVLTRILKIGVPETSFRKSRSPTM